MTIQLFRNAYDGNASDAIGINSDHVISVYETDMEVPDPTAKKKNAVKTIRITNIYTVGGVVFTVLDPILVVLSKLGAQGL